MEFLMTKYVIELTDVQLKLISDACEICAKLKLGQIGPALTKLELKNIQGRVISDYDFGKSVESLIKPIMGLKYDSAWGVGYSEYTDSLFDIHEAIRHRLAWDEAHASGMIEPGEKRKWPEMMSIDYDEPIKCGLEPLPVIIKVNEESK